VREAAGRLAVRDLDGTDTGAAIEAVGELAVIDLDVPTQSRVPAARLLKRAVKRLVAWYLDYFGRQVSALGQAVANLGLALVDRTQRLEAASAALRADVDRLADRVERLENEHRGSA
jgi:ubiquinone biosynthesis protein UbiJ